MKLSAFLFVLACCGISFAASSFVLAIDGSGSMESKIGGVTKFEIARNASLCMLGSVAEGDEGALYIYEGSGSDTRLVRGFTTNMGTLRSAVSGMDPGFGGTYLREGINESATYAIGNAANENKFIIILSDGGSASSSLNQTAAAFREQGVRIYVVGIGVRTNETAGKALSNIAENGGGNFYSTRDYPSACDAMNDAYGDGAAQGSGGGACCPMFILPLLALGCCLAVKN